MDSESLQLVSRISRTVWNADGKPKDWFVGVSHEPEEAIRKLHGVRSEDSFVMAATSNSSIANEVRAFFVNQIGTQGTSGTAEYGQTTVYAYRTAAHTRP